MGEIYPPQTAMELPKARPHQPNHCRCGGPRPKSAVARPKRHGRMAMRRRKFQGLASRQIRAARRIWLAVKQPIKWGARRASPGRQNDDSPGKNYPAVSTSYRPTAVGSVGCSETLPAPSRNGADTRCNTGRRDAAQSRRQRSHRFERHRINEIQSGAGKG